MDYTADIAKLEAQIPNAKAKERALWLELKEIEQENDRRRASMDQLEVAIRSKWSAAQLHAECLQRVVEAFKTINQTNQPT